MRVAALRTSRAYSPPRMRMLASRRQYGINLHAGNLSRRHLFALEA